MSDSVPEARYLASARKYRPQTFGDLVAQDHVAETLRNAVALHRLGQAYVFAGPRGVGKTTAARLLAKAVNCTTPLSEREQAEPCRACESCVSFEEGRSMNVIEIDAASNNGVDDVRELRETVRVPPQGARKKVYILDEAHMLSKPAWNALLKTLEEPPDYVLFIFATTEPHKILPTVLSRTQRFDFRRIAVQEIASRLAEVCRREGVTADAESLMLLARRADGALRDGLSLLDQAVSLCGDTLEGAALRDALGVVGTDLFFAATDRVEASDRAGVLSLVDGVVTRGYDLQEFVLGLAAHLRNLLVARATGTGDLIEEAEATRARYLEAASRRSEADLLHLLMLAEGAATDLRDSRHPRLSVELALLKMASLERGADLESLMRKLDALGMAVEAGTPLAAASATPAPAQPAPAPTATAETPAAYVAPSAATPAASPSAPTSPATPSAPVPSAPVPSAPVPSAPVPSETVPTETVPTAPAQTAPPPPKPTPAAAAPPPSSQATPPLSERDGRSEETQSDAPHPTQEARRPESSAPSGPSASDDDEPRDDGGTEPPLPPTAPPAPSGAAAPEPKPSTAASLFGAPALRPPSGDGSTAALAAPTAHGAPQTAVAADLGPALGQTRDAWGAVIDALRADGYIRLASVLANGRPERIVRGAVEVALPDAFAVTVAKSESDAISAALAGVLGDAGPELTYVAQVVQIGETAAAVDPFERLKQLREEHPVVRALFERFGAEIVW